MKEIAGKYFRRWFVGFFFWVCVWRDGRCYMKKPDLGKQHWDCSPGAGSQNRIKGGIRDILRKVRGWFLIPLSHRSFQFKERKHKLGLDVSQTRRTKRVPIEPLCKPFDLIIPASATHTQSIADRRKKKVYSGEKSWQGLAWLSVNELAYIRASPRLDEAQAESEKRAIYCLCCVEQ